mgnify:CR=1 FL=1
MTGTVLLTGATGFVGRKILTSLLARSLRVRLVVRTGSQNSIEMSSQIESVITSDDIFEENLDWWRNICCDVDTVIHSAWYAEPGLYLQSPKNLDCMIGSMKLAQASIDKGVRRFVGIGTCFEYDLAEGYLSIETPLKPVTTYAATKAATFLALSQYFANNSVEFSWCRLFYLYGEGEHPKRLVPYVRSQLEAGAVAELTSGSQIRDFLDVSIAGNDIVSVAMSDHEGAINICSGEPLTVRSLVESIADEYNRHDLLCFGVRSDNLVDPPCVVGIKK